VLNNKNLTRRISIEDLDESDTDRAMLSQKLLRNLFACGYSYEAASMPKKALCFEDLRFLAGMTLRKMTNGILLYCSAQLVKPFVYWI